MYTEIIRITMTDGAKLNVTIITDSGMKNNNCYKAQNSQGTLYADLTEYRIFMSIAPSALNTLTIF